VIDRDHSSKKQDGRAGSRWLFAGFLLVLTVIWFSSIDYRKLANPDEGRYAEIPREMLHSGDWLTPRLNNIKYFEKPPLQYWITAALYKVFGFNEWTARLWVALTGLLGVVLTWFLGRRLWGTETGVAAALVLLSSTYYIIFSNVLTLDMGFSFFMTLALVAYLMAQDSANNTPRGRAWAMTTWVAASLAVLSKGFAGVALPLLALLAYTLMQRDFSAWRNLRIAIGLPLMLVIVTPWFVGVSVANPEFFKFFFVHEHLQRFASTAHHRTGSWWYFIPIVLLAFLPWLRVLAEGLVMAWRQQQPPGVFNPLRFLLVWALTQFVFFSFSGSKLPAYILPIVPALAIIIGWRLSQLDGPAIAKRVAPLAILTGIIYLTGTEVMEWLHKKQLGFDHYESYSDWLETASLLIALAGLGLWWKRHARRAAVVAFSLACFVAAELIVAGFEQLSPLTSAYNLAQTIKPYLNAETPIFMVQSYNQGLPPYLQRPVTLVDYQDEMYFGLQQEPARWIPTVEKFAALWRELPEGVAVMPAKTLQQFEDQGLPMRIIDSTGDSRVVVRQN
jgi:4-amino-4-deoxy-L-arabinose transferase-like glycosyltransferase